MPNSQIALPGCMTALFVLILAATPATTDAASPGRFDDPIWEGLPAEARAVPTEIKIEVDYMYAGDHIHRLYPDEVDALVQMFACYVSPLRNLDYSHGALLHGYARVQERAGAV